MSCLVIGVMGGHSRSKCALSVHDPLCVYSGGVCLSVPIAEHDQ